MDTFMQTFGYPFLLFAATGLLTLGITWTKQRLNIQADATANAAVQNAVSNFAGKVMLDVAAGKLSLAEVRSGAATTALVTYASETVADSLKQLQVTPETLATMLVGKIGTAVGVAPSDPAVHSGVGL